MDDVFSKPSAAIERWLHESVLPAFDRVMSGDEKLLDMAEVFSELESRYQARKSKKLGAVGPPSTNPSNSSA
jgi:hypothetical protein